jgi:4-amino-4-deoxy-L-arabinose transferase-like glycosyltransferase
LGAIVLIAVSAYGLGAPLLARIPLASRAERAVFAVALGLGVSGTALLIVGLFGALSRTSVILLLAAGVILAVAGRLPIPKASEAPRRRFGFDRLVSVTISAVAVGYVSIRALYPSTAFDAGMYHLPMAKAYVTLGRVGPLPDLRFPVIPALNEVLFAGAMLLCDDLTAQLIEVLFFAIVTAGLMTWADRSNGTLPSSWAVILWLSTPFAFSLASIAYVDMGLTAFAFLSVYAFSCWIESDQPGWLCLAGALAGFAAGTKYTGLFFVVIGSATLLVRAARPSFRRALFAFVAAAAASGGVWYILNTVWTRNPVWPFLGEVFGYRFWTRDDLRSAVWSLRSYGWGHGIVALLLLPYHLLTARAGTDLHEARLWFLLFPLALWAALRNRAFRWPFLVIAAYFFFWFFTSQQVRLLLPIAPVLCLLGALALVAVTNLARGRSNPRLRGLVTIGMLVLWARLQYREGKDLEAAPRVPSTGAERIAYLELLPSYRLYRDLNLRLGGSYTIYAFHDEPMKYYCDGRQLGDWFGPGRYGDAPLSSGQALFEWLRKLDASYLLVNQGYMLKPLPTDASFQSHFEPVYANGPIVAFALKP